MTDDKYRGALLGCRFAYAVQAVGNNLIPILLSIFAAIYGASLTQLSAIVTINFAVQIPADMLSVKICNKLGYRAGMIIAQMISLCGLIMLSILPKATGGNYATLIISSALISVGGGLTEVIVSPLTDSIPVGMSGRKLAFLQSSYCWAACAVIAITSVTVGAIGYKQWYILPLILTILPIINIIIFSAVKLPKVVAAPLPTELKRWGSNSTFYILIAIMFCAGAAEVTMSQWSSLFAEQGLGLDKQVGDVLAPCAFAAAMGIGRIAVGMRCERAERLMIIAALGCTLCYITAAIMPLPAISLIACAICGFAVSVMSPCSYALASNRLAGGSVLLFCIMAIAADIGCTAGPALTGAISDAVINYAPESLLKALNISSQGLSLRLGLAAGAIFPAVLTIICIALNRQKNKV